MLPLSLLYARLDERVEELGICPVFQLSEGTSGLYDSDPRLCMLFELLFEKSGDVGSYSRLIGPLPVRSEPALDDDADSMPAPV